MALEPADPLRRGHAAASLARQIDTRGPPETEPLGPIDQGLRRQCFRVMEEIDVAALGQGRGQCDIAMARAVAYIFRAPLPVGLLQVSLAIERRRRVQPGRFQEGDSRDGFEDRTGREGHLHGAVEERMSRVGKQGLALR